VTVVKYAYFPGCVGQDSCRELDVSTNVIAHELGIELVELKDATCSGAGFVQDIDYDLATVLNARTFAMAERQGLDIMTVCSTCQFNLSKANKDLQDPKRLEMANRYLAEAGFRYNGTVKIKHLLQVLVEDIGLDRLRSRVKVDLSRLNIGAFYGCQILRPTDVLGWEDAEDPKSFENVIEAIGATPIVYEGRTKCCGFPITFVNEDGAMKMNFQNMSRAKGKGADALATSCPLCHLNLDMYQRKTEKVGGAELNLPILHLPQLVGLALGVPPKELRVRKHVIPTDKILERIKPKAAVRA
jgi:succinate dehydrogenase / fumarate reductase cytochrome b subunit